MFKSIKKGMYEITFKECNTKILQLDDQSFIWLDSNHFGKIRVCSYKPDTDVIKESQGIYSLWTDDNVQNSSELYISLYNRNEIKKNYVLPTGLPINLEYAHIMPTDMSVNKKLALRFFKTFKNSFA